MRSEVDKNEFDKFLVTVVTSMTFLLKRKSESVWPVKEINASIDWMDV